MTDKELSLAAGAIVNPKPYRHQMVDAYDGINPEEMECDKCHERVTSVEKAVSFTKTTPCPHPTPIDIDDWNLAIVWFRELRKRALGDRRLTAKLRAACDTVSGKYSLTTLKTWIIDEATSRQIWQIIIKVKGK